MRYRITVRGEGIELRGYIDGGQNPINSAHLLTWLAHQMDSEEYKALVIASPADDDYDPFGEIYGEQG